MLNPCDGCKEYCWYDYVCGRCQGRGYIIDYTIGLGPNGLVPSYVEVTCQDCCGYGYQRSYCRFWRG